jgi:hypothetical protein
MEILKRVTLVLACVCMLLVMYRLLKPEFASKAAAPSVTAAAAPLQTVSPTPVETPTATPVPLPDWEWKLVRQETMVIPAGGALVGYDVPAGAFNKQRVIITAKVPITAAYFPSEYRQAMLSNTVETKKLQIFRCAQREILQATIDCELPSDTAFALAIYDERTFGQMIGAGLGLKLGLKAPAEHTFSRNDVDVQVFRWQCVSNCYVPIEQRGHLPEPG